MTSPREHDQDDRSTDPSPERPTGDAPLDPLSQPVVGGDDGGEPAQGEGAPDSH